jgi:hypothetical protein
MLTLGSHSSDPDNPISGRGGRVAEGGGLLNRYTVQSRIEGSNPSLSAKLSQRFDFLLSAVRHAAPSQANNSRNWHPPT